MYYAYVPHAFGWLSLQTANGWGFVSDPNYATGFNTPEEVAAALPDRTPDEYTIVRMEFI